MRHFAVDYAVTVAAIFAASKMRPRMPP